MPDLGEKQEPQIVANMIVAPNDILKDIREKYFNKEGNLDFRKVIPNKEKWGTKEIPFKTSLEEGRDNLDGCIRFLTHDNPAPEIGRVLSLRYPTTKMAYFSAFFGSVGKCTMVFIKKGKYSYEKHYDLSTRHGRVIYKTAFYGMTEKEKKGKDMEQG